MSNKEFSSVHGSFSCPASSPEMTLLLVFEWDMRVSLQHSVLSYSHTFPLRPFGPKLGNVSRKRFEPRSGSTRFLHMFLDPALFCAPSLTNPILYSVPQNGYPSLTNPIRYSVPQNGYPSLTNPHTLLCAPKRLPILDNPHTLFCAPSWTIERYPFGVLSWRAELLGLIFLVET